MGAAPNTPATGSHTEVQRKRNPNRVIAGQALAPSSKTSATSSSGSSSAQPVSTARYSRSPTLRPTRSGRARGGGGGDGGVGGGWGGGGDGWVAGDSMGSVVIAPKRIRGMSRRCNSRAGENPPAGA